MKNKLDELVSGILEDIANELARRIREEAPEDTGKLKNSVIVEKLKSGVYSVGPQAQYASYIEYGQQPHSPPITPLKNWARRNLGAENTAYAIQKKIQNKGTSRNEFMKRAIQRLINEK